MHGFAENVVRPAAAEWDEREETPWPIIQEAAKIGLYGFEFLAQFWADPTGLSLPDRQRGAVLGRRRHRHGDHGHRRSPSPRSSAAAPASRSSSGCRSASAPQDDPKVAAFCSTEPEAGSDVSAMRTRAMYDEATDEWVLNGQKAWATNGGIANVHVVTAVASTRSSARAGRRRS